MATLLSDPPTAAPGEQQALPGSSAATPAREPTAPEQRSCAKCGSPLDGGQDWCLQCGAGAPDSLGTRAPSWRSAAVVLGAVLVLVAGAATAAYAALSKGSGKAEAVTTVAQVPATPAPATPVTPTATAKIGTPTTVKPIIPSGTATPPKIPTTTPTPIPITPTPVTPAKTPAEGRTAPASSAPSSTPSEPKQEAILLDTDAASTYNPYNYPATNFGDPSLAIDGDSSTGWTAQVEPAVAPKMAEGLLIDLNTSRKLSAVALTTTTPGMTVQIYGANGQAPPTSIIDPAWIPLSSARVQNKKRSRIKLGGATASAARGAKQAYRFVTVWISSAPAASVGTAQAPGSVSVNELELFPLKK